MKTVWIGVATVICVGMLTLFIPRWFGREIVMLPLPAQNEVIPLASPERAQSIYGTLDGYPHMYEFASVHPLHLSLSVRVPMLPLARANVNSIVLRVNLDGSVTEITRLQAKNAEWNTFWEPFGGDRYRQGVSFETDLEPGTYRVEMSTPDNIGLYVLLVGYEKQAVPYMTLLRSFADVKTYFGVSSYRVLVSPVVLGPAALICVLWGGMWLLGRRGGVKSPTKVE